jgi:PIN domain nuclease of toxin-antitoxin system
MTVLIDTHVFLWWVTDDQRLSKRARSTIAAETSLLSVASCWEIAIKAGLGKLAVPRPLDRFLQTQIEINGFALLPLTLEALGVLADLPFHHRDPFDRLLAAEATHAGLPIVSSDPVFRRYGVRRIW